MFKNCSSSSFNLDDKCLGTIMLSLSVFLRDYVDVESMNWPIAVLLPATSQGSTLWASAVPVENVPVRNGPICQYLERTVPDP